MKSVLDRIQGAVATRASFVDAVYSTGVFNLDDDGKVRLGPFSRANGSSCNQGMHTVWVTAMTSTGAFGHTICDVRLLWLRL